MKRAILLLLGLLLVGTVAYAIVYVPFDGYIAVQSRLDVPTGAVTTIVSTTYQPAGAGTKIYPVIIQPQGIGSYRLDPYTAITASNFTPTINDFTTATGDYIYVREPQWFRITPSAGAFSCPVTAISR